MSLQIGNSSEATLALQISELAEHDTFCLVLTPHAALAERLHQELPFFVGTDANICHFPSWETLPYDQFSPHQDIVSERLKSLHKLAQSPSGILIANIQTLMHWVAPPAFLIGHALSLTAGDELDINAFRRQLNDAGYLSVSQVLSPGEFAIRGSIIDIYPSGSNSPFRIDLFDRNIDSIRTFDVESQRSLEVIDQIEMLPAHEFPLTQASCKAFEDLWLDKFPDSQDAPLIKAVQEQRAFPGLEYYLPLFYQQSTSLFDHLPEHTTIIHAFDTYTAAEQFQQEVTLRYNQLRYDRSRPCIPPDQAFLLVTPLTQQLQTFKEIKLTTKQFTKSKSDKYNYIHQAIPNIAIEANSQAPLKHLEQFTQTSSDPIIFSVESAGRKEVLQRHLNKIGIHPQSIECLADVSAITQRYAVVVSAIADSLWIPKKWVLLSELSLYQHRIPQQYGKRHQEASNQVPVYDLTELTPGTAVVHLEHGVGKYLGLSTIDVTGTAQEFLTLEYANGNKLYVPIQSLHLISRYSSTDIGNAPLNRLGSDQWEKAKSKAAKRLEDTAAELLDIYAKRAARQGFRCERPGDDFETFCSKFPYQETPDQITAIEAVIADMKSDQPMDRLLCGDVGFGKTEVAMRATYLAIANKKQAIVLVPTTLLAQQHYENFCDRFAETGANIALLSRAKVGKELQQLLQDIATGQHDIIIGTHKLLSPEVRFKSLGLVIIDEEHRFGVKQKDKMKALRAEVDILTMTATPIPRTLNFALSAIRDLSIISTPPAKRLSVQTFVRKHEKPVIQEAIAREINRGGQVFYLHNEVATIQQKAEQLQAWFPSLKIAVGHGKMREKQLEIVMADFYHNRQHILVCSTIIETGIDIPNANTIIIERADKFGLAQLHQLRGRVGRSHHQAYAYLLTPEPAALTKDAKKRLDAIAHTNSLGGGYLLANHDLEIRGAGDILGKEQSGHIQAIGFSLYSELLQRTIDALKTGKIPDHSIDQFAHVGCEVDLGTSALIPESFIPDVQLRLTFYKRLASAKELNEIEGIQVEMIDRFGLLPEPTKMLFQSAEIKLEASKLGIIKIQLHPEQNGNMQFAPSPKINALALIQLIQNQPNQFKLQGQEKLLFYQTWSSVSSRLDFIHTVMSKLKPSV